jgi:hypothetical protein
LCPQTVTLLDAGEREIFKLLQASYQNEYAEWKQQDAALVAIHKYIREHITLPNHIAIAESSSVWETLLLLQERNEPTDEAYKLDLQYQWSHLFVMDTKNQDWQVIVDKIRAVYSKIKKAKLPEAEGKLPLYQVINLLSKIDRIWADQHWAGLQQTGYYITDVPGLLSNFRAYTFTKPARKPASKGSYAFEANQEENKEPSFQGQGRDGKPKCPCGRSSCRRPATCWYITKKSPEGWTPRLDIADKVARALKNPKIKSIVDKDQSAYANNKNHEAGKAMPPKAQDKKGIATYQASFHTSDGTEEWLFSHHLAPPTTKQSHTSLQMRGSLMEEARNTSLTRPSVTATQKLGMQTTGLTSRAA